MFYAVECGLKSKFIKDRSCRTITDVKEECIRTHKLDKIVKALRLPCFLTDTNTDFHYKSDSAQIQQAHEAWRYGIQIMKQDEKKLVKWLKEF